MFEYTATGGLKLKGCADTTLEQFYAVRFAENSWAYICYKARKGVLEKVYIKKFKVLFHGESWVENYSILYTDTLNSLWTDDELCTHAEALAYATTYLLQQAVLTENLPC